jgi:hypothetical protein
VEGQWKLMKTLNFSASTAPSSAFGTFSPARNRGGEGLSTKGVASGSSRL